MQSQRFVEFPNGFGAQGTDTLGDTIDRDRANLLGLGLGIAGKPGFGRRDEDVERLLSTHAGDCSHD